MNVTNNEENCRPNQFLEAGFSSICEYVQRHSDACEGGGYILWTELKVCAESTILQVLIVAAALVFFCFLFIHLSTTADSFFCKNIASIVDLHKISQNIAGITFMAFGNGAPDIFSSIASITSVNRPRADLAISGLVGGGIFVSTCIIAAIALSKPFLLMRRPVLRDIGFYLAALLLLTFVGNCSGHMPLWQPLAFLGLYILYALVVVFGNLYRQKMSGTAKRRSRVHRAIARLMPKKVVPVEQQQIGKKKDGELILSTAIMNQSKQHQTAAEKDDVLQLPGGILVIPIIDEEEEEFRHASDYLEAGKFFGKEELDAEEGSEDVASDSPLPLSNDSSLVSDSPLPNKKGSAVREEMRRFWHQIAPLNLDKFRRSNWPSRLYRIAKMPSLFLLKLTVPCACQPWSKPLALFHAFMAPLILCAAFQCFEVPLSNALSLGELALMISLLLFVLVIFLTSFREPPACYKWISSYLGFILSIAWIYATAAEVLNVVLMFGNLFQIPYQILGLTAISWCNSIGDLIADVSVARQGMPRMAFSAAIGAPLFNLMVGFGSTFTIAKIQGKPVTIQTTNPLNNAMFLFLGLSLVSTLLLLLLQKFYVRRIHGIVLISIYVSFLIIVIPMGIYYN